MIYLSDIAYDGFRPTSERLAVLRAATSIARQAAFDHDITVTPSLTEELVRIRTSRGGNTITLRSTPAAYSVEIAHMNAPTISLQIVGTDAIPIEHANPARRNDFLPTRSRFPRTELLDFFDTFAHHVDAACSGWGSRAYARRLKSRRAMMRSAAEALASGLDPECAVHLSSSVPWRSSEGSAQNGRSERLDMPEIPDFDPFAILDSKPAIRTSYRTDARGISLRLEPMTTKALSKRDPVSMMRHVRERTSHIRFLKSLV